MVEDQLPSPERERPVDLPEIEDLPEPAEAQRTQEESKKLVATQPVPEPVPESGFASQQRKTRVRGVLQANGKGSLDVANTPLGRYEAQIFQAIERRWQQDNFRLRSHLAPGLITVRFLVASDGSVSEQRRLNMQGASQIQWGLVISAVTKSELPPMSRQVKEELNGEPLEVRMTFNY